MDLCESQRGQTLKRKETIKTQLICISRAMMFIFSILVIYLFSPVSISPILFTFLHQQKHPQQVFEFYLTKIHQNVNLAQSINQISFKYQSKKTMQLTQLPSYSAAEKAAEQKLIILVLTKDESSLVPELWREDFEKSQQVTHHEGKVRHVFLTPKKAEKFAVTEDCFVEFSPKVQELDNYLGVASDLLCKAHKFVRKEKPHTPPSVSIKTGTKSWELILNLVEARNRSKEWANGRGDIEGVPQYFIKQAKRISETYGTKLTVFEGEELLTQGFRLLHAVGRASVNKPAFINLSYNGNPDSQQWVAFVGKGVCFDTGGLDIKPAAGMLNMYLDKHGSTSVLSAFEAVVKEKLPINLTCSVGMVENSINENAYRPSDIIKSRKGLTVEIGNTDAEGRLVLCDCMHWTQENYKVDCLIEESTLTGAMIIALGASHAGIFSNNKELVDSLTTAGSQVNELVWHLPLTDYNRDMMKSERADLNNHGGRTESGSAQAAAFLECFVEEGVRWVHMDIAGTAIVGNEGSGFGSRILVQFARNYAQK